jgi:hypothetical protein
MTTVFPVIPINRWYNLYWSLNLIYFKPVARAGPNFHACINKGKFLHKEATLVFIHFLKGTRDLPWNDLSANSDGFMTSECKERSVNWDGFSLDLIGPPGVITKAFNAQLQVSSICCTVRFSIVQGFQTLAVKLICIRLIHNKLMSK